MLSQGKALERADVQWAVDRTAITHALAGVKADPSTHRRERVLASDDVGCLFEPPSGNQRDVGLHTGVDGTAGAARGPPLLAYIEGIGRRLRVDAIDRLSRGDTRIEVAAELHRADGGTVAATGALVDVHVALSLSDGRLEAAGLAIELHDIGHGVGIDVVVAHALHELG